MDIFSFFFYSQLPAVLLKLCLFVFIREGVYANLRKLKNEALFWIFLHLLCH